MSEKEQNNGGNLKQEYAIIEKQQYDDIISNIENNRYYYLFTKFIDFGLNELKDKSKLCIYKPDESAIYGKSGLIKILTTPILFITLFFISIALIYGGEYKSNWIVFIFMVFGLINLVCGIICSSHIIYLIIFGPIHFFDYIINWSDNYCNKQIPLLSDIWLFFYNDKLERIYASLCRGLFLRFIRLIFLHLYLIPFLIAAITINKLQEGDILYYINWTFFALIAAINFFYVITLHIMQRKYNKDNNDCNIYYRIGTIFDKEQRDKLFSSLFSNNFNYTVNITNGNVTEKTTDESSAPFHFIFKGGDSTIMSYIFTKSFYLILGIIVFLFIGIPVFSAVLSGTLVYILLNFLYSILLYPLFKKELRQELFKIVKEYGIILSLIFTGLVIKSISSSRIFGIDTTLAVTIMSGIFALLVIFNFANLFRQKK